jgi:hypothetical protein
VPAVCFTGFESFASIIAKVTVLGYGGCVTRSDPSVLRHCSIIHRGKIGPSWTFYLLEMMGSKCAFFFDILTPEGDGLLLQNRI